MLETHILEYFKPLLIKRKLDSKLKISTVDKLILTNYGMPNGILDLNFESEILLTYKNQLIIGYSLDNSIVFLQIESGNIIKDNISFLASTLPNFIRQLYVYDYLWNVMVKNEIYGNYREDRNHKKYAKELETQLLNIDCNLLKNDNSYFWGSLIEDIDFGIVG